MTHELKEADAAIITIGRQAGEGMDRKIGGEFNLSQLEQDMIFRVSDQFHAAGKPVIVIINSGSVMETCSWRDRVDAILCAWQPGEEGGNKGSRCADGQGKPQRQGDHDMARSRYRPSLYQELPKGVRHVQL